MARTSSSPDRASVLEGFSGTAVLVGAGKMGGALLEGWLGLGLDPARVIVREPEPSREVAALAARGLRLNPRSPISDPAVITVAVKPQLAGSVMVDVAALVGRETVVVSIMAGRTLAGLERLLPAGTALVRAMPNLPAAIGRGITVAMANGAVSPPQRALVDRLLNAVGAVEWIGDEHLLDAVTAISGSGPAYVFLLAEAMVRAGVQAGLPADLSARLARATIAGSGDLLDRSALSPQALREGVTSPGGTTAAALEVLMAADGLAPLLGRAVAAASRRSRELAG